MAHEYEVAVICAAIFVGIFVTCFRMAHQYVVAVICAAIFIGISFLRLRRVQEGLQEKPCRSRRIRRRRKSKKVEVKKDHPPSVSDTTSREPTPFNTSSNKDVAPTPFNTSSSKDFALTPFTTSIADEDLTPFERPRRYKRPCKFHKNGDCKYGTECIFIHGKKQPEPTIASTNDSTKNIVLKIPNLNEGLPIIEHKGAGTSAAHKGAGTSAAHKGGGAAHKGGGAAHKGAGTSAAHKGAGTSAHKGAGAAQKGADAAHKGAGTSAAHKGAGMWSPEDDNIMSSAEEPEPREEVDRQIDDILYGTPTSQTYASIVKGKGKLLLK